MSHHRVLLLSGGLDSTALLVTGSPDLALYVDYGQPAAEQERAASRRMAERFDVDWSEVTMRGVRLDRMADAPGARGPRVVPARNALLIAAAANHNDGVGCVLYGAHAGDAEAYRDCRPHFVSAMSLALGEAYGVVVHAPYVNKPREDVIADLRGAGIELGWCWSCYTPVDGGPCLECDSCRERR